LVRRELTGITALLNVPRNRIIVDALVFAGLGVMTGILCTKQPDPSSE